MALDSLADHPAVVFPAYILAFTPWTAITLVDYLSPQWRPLSSVRHHALGHLVLSLPPALYIVFYIVVQASAADYKEAAAAIVALLFALHVVARTVWLLAQLAHLRHWTARSVLALRRLGVQYAPLGDGDAIDGNVADAYDIADGLLVNDELVDNQLLHGAARCYLIYKDVDLRVAHEKSRPGVAYLLRAVRRRMYTLAMLFSLPFLMLRDFLFQSPAHSTFHHKNNNKDTRLRQVPHEPVDLWLSWASAFAAQGLGQWIRTLTVAPSSTSPHAATSNAPVPPLSNRASFAGDVLATAVLHSAPSVRSPSSSPSSPSIPTNPYPYPFKHISFPPTSHAHAGRLTKADLLRDALSDGSALPFCEPHTKSLEGYAPHAIKLQRFTEGLPASFGTDVLNFDVEKLEWLTILLHLGLRSLDNDVEVNGNATDVDLPPDANAHVAHEDDESRQMIELGNKDIAVSNLYKQLGFAGDDDDGSLDTLPTLSALSTFPLEMSHILVPSPTNRLVLSATEYIDAWLALAAGDDITYLQQHDRHWRSTYNPDTARQWKLEQNGFYTSFPTLHDYHVALEERRMDSHYYQPELSEKVLEDSLSFMGCSMESVRKLLADWVQRGENNTPHMSWDLPLGGKSHLRNVGRLSDRLSSLLQTCDAVTLFNAVWFQSCLLVELQRLCQVYSASEEDNNVVVMMLAVLSFTSIRFERCAAAQAPYPQPHGAVVIPVLQCESCPDAGLLSFKVVPCGAPQDVSLIVSISMEKTKGVKAVVSISICLQSENVADGGHFEWKNWRDSFMARLEGHVKWQRAHSLPSSNVFITNRSISDGIVPVETPMSGTGKLFVTWLGWFPVRPELSFFELGTHGFLMPKTSSNPYYSEHYTWLGDANTVDYLPFMSRVVVSYESASRDVLRHACLIIKEKIVSGDIYAGKRIHTDPTMLISSLLEKADVILQSQNGEPERAILLLETGASEFGSLRALDQCIGLLIEGNRDISLSSRAAAILMQFVGLIVRKRCISVEDIKQRETDLESVRPLFERVINQDDLSAAVLSPFVSFVLMLPFYLSSPDRLEGIRCKLRRAFFHCGDVQLISALSQIAFAKQRCWESLGEDYVTRNINERNQSCGVVNLNLCRAFLSWKEESDMITKRLLLTNVIAQGDDVTALIHLAHMFRLGDVSTERDWKYAASLYQRALAITDRPDASYYLGVMLKDGGYGLTQDTDAALSLFDSSVAYGFDDRPRAAGYLVRLLRNTSEEAERLETVSNLITLGESSHCGMVVYNMALVYHFGHFGVPIDLRKAKKMYQWAMELGDMCALKRLMVSFYDDGGSETDIIRVAELCCVAIVKCNNLDALYTLATLLRKGRGVREDCKLALAMFECGMRGGNDLCETNLISMHLNGAVNVPKDEAKAKEICRESIRLRPSQRKAYLLGTSLIRSSEPMERQEGVELLEAVVTSRAHLKAMYTLGKHYRMEKYSELFNGKRSHDLLGSFVNEVSYIDDVLKGDISRGEMNALNLWFMQCSDVTKEGRTWDYILDLWEFATGNNMYFDALRELTIDFSKGRYGVAQDIIGARKIWDKMLGLKRWMLPFTKFSIASHLKDGSHGLQCDIELAADIYEECAPDVPLEMQCSVVLDLSTNAEKVKNGGDRALKLFDGICERHVEGNVWHDAQHSACLHIALHLLHKEGGSEVERRRGRDLLQLGLDESVYGEYGHTMLHVALMKLHGLDGFDVDTTGAIALLERAVTKEIGPVIVMAQSLLAKTLEDVQRDERDIQNAFLLWQSIIDRFQIGDGETHVNESVVVQARSHLAAMWLTGQAGLSQSAVKARELLEGCLHFGRDHEERDRSERRDRADALKVLAFLLATGPMGVERDSERAAELLRESNEENDDEYCIRVVSSLYDGDISVREDSGFKVDATPVDVSFCSHSVVSVEFSFSSAQE